jgi:hypothetical protein
VKQEHHQDRNAAQAIQRGQVLRLGLLDGHDSMIVTTADSVEFVSVLITMPSQNGGR